MEMRLAAGIRLVVVLTLGVSAWSDPGANLLRNPGFEELVMGLPAAWKAFVYPAPGAYARMVEPGHGGARAAALVIATPYRREPDNNWSQHVAVPEGARRVKFAGWVRAEGNSADAFLWLQCWQRRPARLLAEARSPALSRRNEWVYVEVAMDVPAGTDFAMARLTLRGAGEGWFDDLELTAESSSLPAESAPPAPAPGASAGSGTPTGSPQATDAAREATTGLAPSPQASTPEPASTGDAATPSPLPATSAPVAPETPSRGQPDTTPPPTSPKTAAPAAAPPPVAGTAGTADNDGAVLRQTDSLEQTLGLLRQENRLLLDALLALRAQHEAVQRDLESLRRELDALRAQAGPREAVTTRPEAEPEAMPGGSVPPLAPRGSAWDDVSVPVPQTDRDPSS